MENTLNMTHEEWLKARRKGIGGSDVAKILGLSQYSSPFEVWLDKTGQVPVDTSNTSEAAYWGTVMEELVAQEFAKRTGKKVRRANKMFHHSEFPFLLANVDRLVVGEDAILECKTASEYLKDAWQDDEIPPAYLAQVQHYLNVLGKKKAYIACLIGGNKFVWKEIERDDELIEIIQERLIEFWTKYVEKNVQPEVNGSRATKEFLGKVYGEDYYEHTIELNAEQNEDLMSLKSLKETKKEVDEEITRIENKLKQALGQSEATYGNSSLFLISWKKQSRTVIDAKILKKDYPKVYDEVTKISESKRFLVKEK